MMMMVLIALCHPKGEGGPRGGTTWAMRESQVEGDGKTPIHRRLRHEGQE